MSSSGPSSPLKPIPEVAENLPALTRSVRALKELTELLAGLRGDDAHRAFRLGEHQDYTVPRMVHDIRVFKPATPTTSELLAVDLPLRAGYFPANFEGSRFWCNVAPTASFTIAVWVGSQQVGSSVVAAGATVATCFTTGSQVINFTTSDMIRLIAPSGVDATIAGIFVALKGWML